MLLDCAGIRLDLSSPRVMGILNLTPDSFSDGGRFVEVGQAVEHAERLQSEGADILDLGGESTRPGAQPVSAQAEIDRVLPVLEALRGRLRIPISIDTSKPEVMRAAVAAGAGMINDVYALRQTGAPEAAAQLGVPVCLMHMQGEPRTMQAQPDYRDVVSEVRGFLQQRIDACLRAGIPKQRILIDPGFGFGKLLEHNLTLLRDLRSLRALGCPILVGISRKSMLGAMTGRAVADRQAASVAAAVLAIQRGADIVRVHDVGPTVDALKVLRAVEGDPPGLAE